MLDTNPHHVAHHVGKRFKCCDGVVDSLLDHSMIIYGAGMGDSNSHASTNLPILLAGGGAGTGGHHIKYSEDTPMANLHLSLLDKMGVPVDSLGHSTGRLSLDPLSNA